MTSAEMKVCSGQLLKIKGLVEPQAKSFSFNIGRSDDEFSLHFNPRFDEHGDTKTIVCNSKVGGAWGEEQRDNAFPFKQGEEVKIFIYYKPDVFEVKVSDDSLVKFPNRCGDQKLAFLGVDGGFRVVSFKVQ
ncbi:galectin-1-like [Acipenser oxyrinchus oxyrinchus]|uniref:Galectin n=1 Tax=Acipenser oxyrinchus oxyrinchus TaxID=40147 RepID=A0AAD8CHB9_ACIOX|nr:galectin-1-like [Acipenser oxyrinchus oxyrinchus]